VASQERDLVAAAWCTTRANVPSALQRQIVELDDGRLGVEDAVPGPCTSLRLLAPTLLDPDR
jgi:hypothetical protein